MAEHIPTTEEVENLPLLRFLTYRILRVHSKLNTQAARILKKSSGLPLAHWRVMAMIGLRGETTLSEIVRLSQIDKGQTSRCLKAMIAEGLVEAQDHESDQRSQMLRLTPKGQATYDDTLPRMRKRQAHLMQMLTPAETAALYSALDKLEIAAEWEGD